jgi:pimeloyl-[acyl-carrier protein] synthase
MHEDRIQTLNALGTTAFHNDPAPFFAQMHSPGAPSLYKHPSGDGLVLTAYRELQNTLKHPLMQAQNRTARASGPNSGGAMARMFDSHPVFMNEPRHRPVRLAATAAIGLERKDWMHEHIQRISSDLIANLKKQGGGDLVSEFAFALSSRMWCRILGLPESEAHHLLNVARKLALPLQFAASEHDLQLANEGAAALIELLAASARKDEPHNQTLSLVRRSLEENPDPDESIDAMAMTTSLTFDAIDGAGGMTSNFLHCLMTECDAGNDLRRNIGSVESYWIEAARLQPPLLGLFRSPIEDVEIDGMQLKKGQNILTLNAAGNRDPRKFAQPDSFDPTREPNRPLSFGFGGRGCIGRHLASMQAEIGVSMLLAEIEKIIPQTTQPDWGKPGLLRAVQRLDVSFA